MISIYSLLLFMFAIIKSWLFTDLDTSFPQFPHSGLIFLTTLVVSLICRNEIQLGRLRRRSVKKPISVSKLLSTVVAFTSNLCRRSDILEVAEGSSSGEGIVVVVSGSAWATWLLLRYEIRSLHRVLRPESWDLSLITARLSGSLQVDLNLPKSTWVNI